MHRYIALIWNDSDAQQSDVARRLADRLKRAPAGWRCIVHGPRLAVFHPHAVKTPSIALRCPLGSGVVLGKLFGMPTGDGTAHRRFEFDAEAGARILRTGGRDLVDRFWGDYVALLSDGESLRTSVLRSPTGSLPALLTAYQGVHVVFSCPQDCERLGIRSFTINWNYVAAHVACWMPYGRETGLNEVSDLLPGERIQFGGADFHRSLLWDPLKISGSDIIDDPAAATIALRRVTRACVHAWASCYSGVLHTLSGGLDSSIVLSCLKDAPMHPAITCLNYVSQCVDGDERQFARLAAQSADAELLEHARDPSTVRLEGMLNITPFVRPWSYRYALDHHRFEAELARERGASAIFSGGGGDQLFYQCHADLAVADHVNLHGLRMDLFRVAWDAARVERRSIWSVLREGIPTGLLKRRWDRFSKIADYRALVNRELLQPSRWDSFVHPWLAESTGMPHGKVWHVQMMSVPPVFHDPLGRPQDPERIFPFMMSQPLTELCLRIPTYTLISGGWDRAIARRAFARDVPRAIITRRTKGHVSADVLRIYLANMDFVQGLLLDGLLVSEGLLDRTRLAGIFTKGNSLAVREFAELDEHLSTEIWLRRWSESHAEAAA